MRSSNKKHFSPNGEKAVDEHRITVAEGNNIVCSLPIALSSTEEKIQKILYVKPKKGENYWQTLKRKEKNVRRMSKCIMEGSYNDIWIKEKDTGIIKKIQLRCNNKVCYSCMTKRMLKTRDLFSTIVSTYKTPTFMTVSPKNYKKITKEIIQKENKIFARMREYIKRGHNIKKNRKFRFKDYVSVMEIKYNRKGDPKYKSYRKHGYWKKKIIGYHKKDNWNLHFHMVYDGDYIPVKWARKCYEKASKKRSHHVNFNYVYNLKDVVFYVSKYVTKMCFEDIKQEVEKNYYEQTYGLKFIKIVGYRPDKEEGKYTTLASWVKSNYGFGWVDTITYINDIDSLIANYSFRQYNVDKTFEENFFEYASTQEQLRAMGL